MKKHNPFEAAMRLRGHKNFRREGGRYCLQELNEFEEIWRLGWKAGFEAENSFSAAARQEVGA